MSNRYGPRIVTDQLYWYIDAADRNSYPGSGTTVANLTGTGHSAYLISGTTFSNDYGGKFDFANTNNQHMTSSPLGDVSAGFSISSFFYQESLGSAIVQMYTGSSNYPLRISVQDNYRVVFQTWTATALYSSDNVINLNRWNQITCTCSGTSSDGGSTTCKTYINGELSVTGSRPMGTSMTYGFRIGRLNADYFTGSIANVMVHKKELNDNEVLQNYNATKGRFGL